MDLSMKVAYYSLLFYRILIAFMLAVTRAIFPTCRKFRAVEMASGIINIFSENPTTFPGFGLRHV